jgi:hypothetical protein
VTALAVVPTGSPSSPIDVTTVTPVAKWPIACRNSEALTSADSSTAVMILKSRHVDMGIGFSYRQAALPDGSFEKPADG